MIYFLKFSYLNPGPVKEAGGRMQADSRQLHTDMGVTHVMVRGNGDNRSVLPKHVSKNCVKRKSLEFVIWVL